MVVSGKPDPSSTGRGQEGAMWWLWSDWALSPVTQAWFDWWFPPRACSTLNLRTGIAFCPSWMRRSYARGRALDETGAADRDMPPQGQDPAPGSAAHDFAHCLAASERGQGARPPG